jgi:aminomethyltransferase
MPEKRTALYEQHVEAGAKLVPFSGWEMPVQYEGVRQEHMAVRTGCGVFDVSHMGEVSTEGPQADELLQRLLSNDVTKIEAAGAQYSLLCREDGGILDDLFTYRLAPDRFLTVTNAANHEKDHAWMAEHSDGYDATARDAADDYAMLAVQGPHARELLGDLFVGKLPPRMHTAVLPLHDSVAEGAEGFVCGTGYTGEDGVEVLLPPDAAPDLWRALLEAGATPCGLAARDTLRLEACFHLYGNDMDESRNPIEAGLGWVCKEETGFIGAEAVSAAREAGPEQKLVPLALTGPGIPRQGNEILHEGEAAGIVTSGTLSPCLQVGIGMGYVEAGLAEAGTEIEVDVRGKRRPARVESRPLYSKEDRRKG